MPLFSLRGFLPLAALLLASVALPHPAAAQIDSREGIALQNQILELRRDIQSLHDQGARGGGGSSLGTVRPAPVAGGGGGEITTQLLDRVTQLEDEVRRLRGRVDEVDNARQVQGNDLAKQIGDLNFKIDAGAGGGRAAGGSGGLGGPGGLAPASLSPGPGTLGNVPPPLAPMVSAGPPPRTPELTLQEGNAALARRDYKTAEAAAREVLSNQRSPRGVDAQFLLAQALAGKRDYAQAAVAYDDSYNRSRTGAHAQDSLLGLANSLTAINEKRAACATLDKMRAEFPRPRADLATQIGTVRASAGCP